MPPSPLLRACLWLVYTFVIAEAVPFGILCLLTRLDGSHTKVLESFLGMTTMVLIGFGILVAATGDRLIERGITSELIKPFLWISSLLGLSTYFLYKQYIQNVAPDKADLAVTCAIGLIAIFAASQVKYQDWQRTYSFSQATR